MRAVYLAVRLASFVAIATSTCHLRGDPVTPENRARILDALPSSAPAKPKKARRILIYTQTKGYRHASIETGVEALELMGKRTGAYSTSVADKPEVFTTDNLRDFDALLFLSTTGEIFDTVETRKALMDYVRGGCGVVGIHGATDSCYKWPEYGEMMGGYFLSHPWTHDWNVTLWNEDPTHPLNAAFKGAISFPVQDEIYQLKDPYSRKTHRVILSLDLRRSGERHPDIAPKIVRTDNDFAISQLRTYGKGRVFYCSLGHNHAIYWNPTILAHYLAGIQWAVGDLQADATPRARPVPPPLASDPALFEAVGRTAYDADQAPFDWLDQAIAEAGLDPKALALIEARLVALLAQPSITPAARQAVSQRLAEVIPGNPSAGRESLQTLSRLLLDASQVNNARLALEPVPGNTVDRLFLDAMVAAKGEVRNALIHSIGKRRIANAVPALRRILSESNPAAVSAAAAALGEIATKEALDALESSPASTSPEATEAILLAASRLPASISAKTFANIEASSSQSPAARLAAFRGVIKSNPSTALSLIIATLKNGPSDRRNVALEAVHTLEDKRTAAALGDAMTAFDIPTQVAVLNALARRGEPQSTPIALASLGSPDASVRLAAISALALLPGTVDAANALAAHAARPRASLETKAAFDSLAALNGPGINQAVQRASSNAQMPARLIFIRALAPRALFEAVPALLSMQKDEDPLVRNAALEALEILAGHKQQAPLLDWALAATDPQERNRAVRSLIATTLRNQDLSNRNAGLIERLTAGDTPAQLLLLPALPRLADAKTLAAASSLLNSSNSAVVGAAVTALARWPDSSPLNALLDFAERTGPASPVSKSAASAAAVHFKTLCEANPGQIDVKTAGRLLKISPDAATGRSLLFLLSRTANPEALQLAERCANVPDLAVDAHDAILAIRANQVWPPAFKATAGAGQLKALTDNSLSTAWSVPATAGQQLTVDLKRSRPIRRLILERGGARNDYPPAYEIYLSDDPSKPGAPLAAGEGSRTSMDIRLPAVAHGRYLVIRNTVTRDSGKWSIAEFRIE
ncbi:MAG: ThuA domain-containing protein [Opitutaceae bacterium]|nr:ThuA domain-containing protein [Opitutaceae bacterium]